MVRGLRIAVLSRPILTVVEERCNAKPNPRFKRALVKNAKVALYEALADVAKTNPSQASAVVLAMAIQGVCKQRMKAAPAYSQ